MVLLNTKPNALLFFTISQYQLISLEYALNECHETYQIQQYQVFTYVDLSVWLNCILPLPSHHTIFSFSISETFINSCICYLSVLSFLLSLQLGVVGLSLGHNRLVLVVPVAGGKGETTAETDEDIGDNLSLKGTSDWGNRHGDSCL